MSLGQLSVGQRALYAPDFSSRGAVRPTSGHLFDDPRGILIDARENVVIIVPWQRDSSTKDGSWAEYALEGTHMEPENYWFVEEDRLAKLVAIRFHVNQFSWVSIKHCDHIPGRPLGSFVFSKVPWGMIIYRPGVTA